MSALPLRDKMPLIHLFVISIVILQEQGIERSDEIEKVIPDLIEKASNLVIEILE